MKIENLKFFRHDYTLHLVSMTVASSEKELNDSAVLVTVLIVGQTRTGVLTTDADVDYYKVTFTEQATVTLRFSYAQSTNKITAYFLTVEQNDKPQWTANIKGDSGDTE